MHVFYAMCVHAYVCYVMLCYVMYVCMYAYMYAYVVLCTYICPEIRVSSGLLWHTFFCIFFFILWAIVASHLSDIIYIYRERERDTMFRTIANWSSITRSYQSSDQIKSDLFCIFFFWLIPWQIGFSTASVLFSHSGDGFSFWAIFSA